MKNLHEIAALVEALGELRDLRGEVVSDPLVGITFDLYLCSSRIRVPQSVQYELFGYLQSKIEEKLKAEGITL